LWGLLNTNWQVTPLVCAVILLLLAVELVHYVETTNRQFSAFLESIREHDFSTRITLQTKGTSFSKLSDAYALIMDEFLRLNSEREMKHQLLEILVEHVTTALLCIDQKGELVFVNRAAKTLFRSPHLQYTSTLGKVTPELPPLLEQARAGEQQLVRLKLGGEILPLSMSTSRFQFFDDNYLLVSFQDIREELDRREIDSWQKLIRVLTHEIMNSVTPIVSLTDVICSTLLDAEGQLKLSHIRAEEAGDLLRSLQAIEARGKGLVRFVQTYNSFANPPQPFFTEVTLAPLLERLALLLQPELDKTGITLIIRCEPRTLAVQADMQQLEQVLINLIKNAREALVGKNTGHIHVVCSQQVTRGITITVADNGPGLEPEKLQDIFIPFYTTKKDGSGIGLSISRQLVVANRGQLSVSSEPGKGCEFTLSFRQSD
jgi:two-component system, NtrC family, nitrogen regulation sensor histidine kinase NtrY